MTHYQNIPNWQLFVFKFEPTQTFIEQIESRFDALQHIPESDTVAKYINVQIGLLSLRDREISQEIMTEFLEIFKN